MSTTEQEGKVANPRKHNQLSSQEQQQQQQQQLSSFEAVLPHADHSAPSPSSAAEHSAATTADEGQAQPSGPSNRPPLNGSSTSNGRSTSDGTTSNPREGTAPDAQQQGSSPEKTQPEVNDDTPEAEGGPSTSAHGDPVMPAALCVGCVVVGVYLCFRRRWVVVRAHHGWVIALNCWGGHLENRRNNSELFYVLGLSLIHI